MFDSWGGGYLYGSTLFVLELQASLDFEGQIAEPPVTPRGTLSESSIHSRTANDATRGLGHESEPTFHLEHNALIFQVRVYNRFSEYFGTTVATLDVDSPNLSIEFQ